MNKDSTIPKHSYSLESSIAQQGPEFFNELTKAFDKVIRKSRKEIHDSTFKDDLEGIIFKHLGVKIKVNIGSALNDSQDMSYSVGYYPPSNVNPLGDRNSLSLRKVTNIKVDDRNAKIKGDISFFKPVLYVDLRIVISGLLSAEENAAVVLHECGHIYYGFSLIGKLASTNMALRDLARDYNSVTTDQREILIHNARSKLGLEQIDNEKLAKSKDVGEVILVLYSDSVAKIFSEMGSGVYDTTLSEYMADQYATRHGAGKHLIKALDRLNNLSGVPDFTRFGSAARLSKNIASVVIVLIHTYLVAVPAFVVTAIVSAIAAVSHFTFVRDVSSIMRLYDRDRNRLQRIRNQAQLRVRTRGVSEVEKRIYLEDIKEIDKIIENTKNNDLLGYWLARLMPSNRKFISQSELQMAYENLAYNKLYDKSLALSIA